MSREPLFSWLMDGIRAQGGRDALVAGNASASYATLVAMKECINRELLRPLPAGSVVAIAGDYDGASIAALLAVIDSGHVAVPLSRAAHPFLDRCLELGEAEWVLDTRGEQPALGRTSHDARHTLYERLRHDGHSGLVLFSSGSTGTPKAAVHDMVRLLDKYRKPRRPFRTLVFLLFDHIGGINTVFSVLSSGGTLVLTDDRSPAAVVAAIERHRVELLPASPTFLNLLLLSGACRDRDLSSLRLVTYGTEPMPDSTLRELAAALPGVTLQQTYRLTELGILGRSSRARDSLWVRIGGDGFETKVVDGRLRVRARSAMLGYLNAPSPFDAEGFFDTGDIVAVDGEWVRFLGRETEIINVGGRKVHPSQVESVLLEMDNVADVAVTGESNPIMGQVVTARVRVVGPETPAELKLRIRRFCAERLESWQVPARVSVTTEPLHSTRFKRIR